MYQANTLTLQTLYTQPILSAPKSYRANVLKKHKIISDIILPKQNIMRILYIEEMNIEKHVHRVYNDQMSYILI